MSSYTGLATLEVEGRTFAVHCRLTSRPARDGRQLREWGGTISGMDPGEMLGVLGLSGYLVIGDRRGVVCVVNGSRVAGSGAPPF